jgi:hypothetical protein
VLMVWGAACVWPYAAADAVVHDGAGRAGLRVMPAAAHAVGLQGARDCGSGVGGAGARGGGGCGSGGVGAAADSPPVQGVNDAPSVAAVASAAAAAAAAVAAVAAVAAAAAAAAAAIAVAVVVEQRGADDQCTAFLSSLPHHTVPVCAHTNAPSPALAWPLVSYLVVTLR